MNHFRRFGIGTRYRAAIGWILLLTLALLLASVAQGQPILHHVPSGETGPITVTSHVRFTPSPDDSEQGVWLAGLAVEPAGEPRLLSVVFSQVELGWFGPLWGLQLQSDAGLLPAGLHPQEGTGFLQGSQYALLQSLAPEWGHEYEVQLGYDPLSGATSIQLFDKTERKRVYARNLQLRPYEGLLYAAAGVAEVTSSGLVIPQSPIAAVEEISVADHLLPVGLPWWVMQREGPNQSFRATGQIDRRLESILRISTPWTEFQPGFALRLLDGEGESVLYVPYEYELEMTPVPVAHLPYGRYTAVLEYSLGDRTWQLDQREIAVGVADVQVVHVEAYPEAEDRLALSGTMRIESDGPLGLIAVGLDAAVIRHSFSYDAASSQGQFLEEGGSPVRVLAPVDLEMDGTSKVLEFVGRLSLPEQTAPNSLWEVSVEPFTTPANYLRSGTAHRTWVGGAADEAPWEGFLQNETVRTEEIVPGLLLVNLSGRIAAGPVRMHLLVADLTTPGLMIDALVGAHLTTPASSRWPRSQVSQMVEASGAVAGVNAAFFDISDTMNPLGILMQSGRLLKTEVTHHENALGVDIYGKPYLGSWHWVGGVQKADGSAYRPVLGLNVTDPGVGLVLYRTPATRSVGKLTDDISMVELVVRELPEGEMLDDSGNRTQVLRGVVDEVRTNQAAVPLREGIFVVAGGGEYAEYLLNTFDVGDIIEVPYRLAGTTEWPHLKSPQDLYAAVSGGVALLRNGRYGPGVVSNTDRHPRTAVGISLDQSKLYILVVDGRSQVSVGMTYREMADFFRYIGAFHALNFDGGGSSAMVVYDERHGGVRVVNTPSDGRQRYVPDGLGLFYSEPVALEPAEQ